MHQTSVGIPTTARVPTQESARTLTSPPAAASVVLAGRVTLTTAWGSASVSLNKCTHLRLIVDAIQKILQLS